MAVAMIAVQCLGCRLLFYKRVAETRRSPNHYCSKVCRGCAKSMASVRAFSFKYKVSDKDCWEWIGSKNACGYGTTALYGKHMTAHRASFIIHDGGIPQGMHVCHTCDNPACVNPRHLFLGTHQDNMDDMRLKGRRYKKLSYEAIVTIKNSKLPTRINADAFNVSERTIRYWKKKPLPAAPSSPQATDTQKLPQQPLSHTGAGLS